MGRHSGIGLVSIAEYSDGDFRPRTIACLDEVHA